MLEYFSKINYKLNGQTLQFTDLFKSVNLNTDNFTQYGELKNTSGGRPDQLADTIYNDPNLYWSLFLFNGVRNPFKQWHQSTISNQAQTDTEYASKVFQFANTSEYLPGNTLYFDPNANDAYYGVSLGNISINDIITFETGDGAFKLRAFGAGEVVSTSACGHPHYGQALIPDNFTYKNNVYKIGAGEYFSAAIDTVGRIWGWGYITYLNGFDVSDRLYKSQDSGYTLINVTKNKIIASKPDNKWYCYGAGCTSTISYPVTESKTISKIEFTKGNPFSGIVLFSDNTVKTYGGLTHCSSYTSIKDIACAEKWCLGINQNNTVIEFNTTGTAQGIASQFTTTDAQKIVCGISHAFAINSIGVAFGAGDNTQGQLDLPLFQYSSISAGRYHSVGIVENNTLQTAGVVQYNSGICTGSTGYTPLLSVYGTFDQIASGNDHIVCVESGTNVKYTGRVELIDEQYRRIYVKGFTGSSSTVLIDDPSSTVVTILNSNGLGVKKTLQHQLLSIDTYGNTPMYMTTADGYGVIDVVADDGLLWKTSYITGYKDASTNDVFVTPNKLNTEVFNTNIKYINSVKLYALQNALKRLLSTTNKINIKMSDL